MTLILSLFVRCRKGLATVEAALILPVLITLTLAAADAGMLMLTIHKLEAGLSSGGSYLARSKEPDLDAIAAKNVAVTGHADAGHSANVSGWSPGDVTVDIVNISNTATQNTPALRGSDTVKLARFSTSYSYKGLGFLGMVNAGNITLTAKHEERIFGGTK